MFYIVDRMEEDYILELEIPDSYEIITSMRKNGNTINVKGYDLLKESPIIYPDSLQYDTYIVDGILFIYGFKDAVK